MKVTLEWIKEFVPVPFSSKELAHRLTLSGIEVEGVEERGDDVVFTLGVTPNRGDCLSVRGIAREIAALQNKRLAPKKYPPPKGIGAIRDFIKVRVVDTKGCPRYMARGIRGVSVKPSPSWLAKRLEAVGVRVINNIVDCTNYVMWEMGYPLHAFDYRFLRGEEIVVRTEKESMEFTTLDGLTRLCEPTDLFICDREAPVALAGIMGGANSEIREDTRDIVLEAAFFDPKRIHRTSKRLKISSDSSKRFERGVDPNGVQDSLHRVTQLIQETAGGTPTKGWIDHYPKKFLPVSILLDFKEIERILGLPVSSNEAKRFLSSLGFQVETARKGLKVRVPTVRPDITSPIDLIEEVARLKGYETWPADLPKIRMGLPKRPEKVCAERITIDCLTKRGYSETCHLSFTSLEKTALLKVDESELVFIDNPLSEDHRLLRPSLLPGLLDALAYNLNRQRKNLRFFELGKVYRRREEKIDERIFLGAVSTGNEWPSQWQFKGKKADFYSLKGLLTELAHTLHIEDFQYVSDPHFPFLNPSGGGIVLHKNQKVGWCGLLSPEVLKKWDIEDEVYAIELDWEVMRRAASDIKINFKSLLKYPYIERDISVVLSEDIEAKSIEEVIRGAKIPMVDKVEFFDLFRGGSLPAGKKSVGVNIRFVSEERTLTNEEVNRGHEEIIRALERELGGELRK